jgi:hypothetical protein
MSVKLSPKRLLTTLGLAAGGAGLAWAVIHFTRSCIMQRPDCWGDPAADCPNFVSVCQTNPWQQFMWLLPVVLVAVYWFYLSRHNKGPRHLVIAEIISLSVFALAGTALAVIIPPPPQSSCGTNTVPGSLIATYYPDQHDRAAELVVAAGGTIDDDLTDLKSFNITVPFGNEAQIQDELKGNPEFQGVSCDRYGEVN